MITAAWALCIFLITVGLLQAALYAYFSHKMRRNLRAPAELAARTAWPKATVVLSLRGADAGLTPCLRGLMQQDYPNYRVKIVVDAESDSAWRVAQRIRQELKADHVEVEALKIKRLTCSLKCSALVQAVSELDADCEILAFLDADVVPHATWLKELVFPLAEEERIGAATGNRWFMPSELSWGGLTRSLWSAGALVQMCALGIPWGGSLATRVSLIRDSGLVEKWAKSFNDDLLVGDMVQSARRELHFVPTLVMVNHELCSLPGLTNWLTRQLIHVRFYHSGWIGVVVLGLLIATAVPIGLAGGVIAAVTGQFAAASWSLLGGCGYLAIMYALYVKIAGTVEHVLQFRPAEMRWRYGAMRLAGALVMSHIIYGRSLIGAMIQRKVDWRGITYKIRGPWQVKMLRYHPYQPEVTATAVPVAEAA